MSQKNGAILNWAAAAMASALLTGAGAWFAFGRDVVTREELAEYVTMSSPWVREAGKVTTQLEGNREAVGKLEAAVERLVEAQHSLLVEQRVLVQKVERLLH